MSAVDFWRTVQKATRHLYEEPKRAPLDDVLFAKVAELGTYTTEDVRTLGAPLEEANVLTSATGSEQLWGSEHKVVLDLDVPAQLLPSSTEGHFHLLIDRALSWERYSALLDALVDAGLVEPGFVGASKARGYTAVRLPWIKKETPA